MEIRPIHTKADYKAALKAVAALVDANPKRDTPDADRLEVIGTLIETYEAQHYGLELPDPVEAVIQHPSKERHQNDTCPS
jgi:HTH-type transcriptional regulator / antitoxin HigA